MPGDVPGPRSAIVQSPVLSRTCLLGILSAYRGWRNVGCACDIVPAVGGQRWGPIGSHFTPQTGVFRTGNPGGWRRSEPKIWHWRIRGRSSDSQIVTLGKYNIQDEAQVDYDKIIEEGFYRNVKIEQIITTARRPYRLRAHVAVKDSGSVVRLSHQMSVGGEAFCELFGDPQGVGLDC